MKFHIVRTGETVEDILFLYNLTKDELVEENRHIRVWDRLIPGTKLKIPPLTEAIEDDVSEMEPLWRIIIRSFPMKKLRRLEVAAFRKMTEASRSLILARPSP